jgi:hypothetical protein
MKKEPLSVPAKKSKQTLSKRLKKVYHFLFKQRTPYSKLGDIRNPKNIKEQEKQTFYFYIKNVIVDGCGPRVEIHIEKNDFPHIKGTYKSNLKASSPGSAESRVKGIARRRLIQEKNFPIHASNIQFYII